MRAVLPIYRKELVDTLRDRKTLIFMLLLPTLIVPLLMFGMGRFTLNFVRQQALEEVTMAADAESQQRYHQMAHAHFLRGEVAGMMRVATLPLLRQNIDNEALREAMAVVPEEIFQDPVAYADWARSLASQAQEALYAEGEVKAPAIISNMPEVSSMVTPELAAAIESFYVNTLRDVGLVRFVDPAELPEPGMGASPMPEQLAHLSEGERVAAGLAHRRIHGYLVIPADFDEVLADRDRSAEIAFYHDSTIHSSEEAARRVRRVVDNYRQHVVEARVAQLGMGPDFLRPISLAPGTNVATTSQMAVATMGGLLPYLIIFFAYLGGIYPAVDLGAGEKERNTLETLLLSPASRTEIALGKFLVILTTSLCAALLGLLSLAFSFWVLVPPEFLDKLNLDVGPANFVAIMFLAVPPAAIFASIFLAVSIYARSFKEAQNYMTPIGLIVFLPVVAALLPGVELNWKLSLVPLVNISLLMKELLKNTIPWGYYSLTFASTALLAALSVALCVWMFKREEVLFRS